MSKICVLDREEADSWSSTGVHPPCRDHQHISTRRARALIQHPRFNGLISAEWCGKNAVTVERKVSVLLRPRDSGGFITVQLVPGAAELTRAEALRKQREEEARSR